MDGLFVIQRLKFSVINFSCKWASFMRIIYLKLEKIKRHWYKIDVSNILEAGIFHEIKELVVTRKDAIFPVNKISIKNH